MTEYDNPQWKNRKDGRGADAQNNVSHTDGNAIHPVIEPINLVDALDSAFPPLLVVHLAGKFGFPPKVFHHVLECAEPILVMAMVMAHIAQGRGKDGSVLLDTVMSPEMTWNVKASRNSSVLFDTVVSPETNENIVSQFLQLARTTSGMKGLENAGQTSVARGLTIDPGALSDFVAKTANIPEQPAYAMTGLIAAALFGILKQHLIANRTTLSQGLDATLVEQWPMLDAQVTDPLAKFLRFSNAAALRREVKKRWLEVPGDGGRRNALLSNAMGEKMPAQANRAKSPQTFPAQEEAPAHRWGRIIAAVLAIGTCAAAVGGAIWLLRTPSRPDRATYNMDQSGDAFAPSESTATPALAPATAPASASGADAHLARSLSGSIQPKKAIAASAASGTNATYPATASSTP